MKFKKRDVVLWLRHLHEGGLSVPPGRAALLRLGDAEVVFEPMRPGPGGRPTYGLRASGANRNLWTSIPLGTAIDLALVRLLEATTAVPAETIRKPQLPEEAAARPPSAAAHAHELFDAVELPSSRTAAFDVYIMVDWSASSPRKTGKDSIWWCLCTWRDSRLVAEVNENPPRRQACFDALRERLWNLLANGSSVLLGFDFPYGYPAGFARVLGLGGAAWRAIWDELNDRVVDDQAVGTNNRFEVASDLNQCIGAAEGPFWGHPQGRPCAQLRSTEPSYPVRGLARLREADRYAPRVQPAWKLWGNGSVGSQALLGIPILAQLRDDRDLRSVSVVWPFETGCVLPPRGLQPRIIFAEIYPSIVRLPEQIGDRVKDSAQVEAIARHFARHDAANTLGDLFSAPAALESDARRRVESDEGWILGVKPHRP